MLPYSILREHNSPRTILVRVQVVRVWEVRPLAGMSELVILRKPLFEPSDRDEVLLTLQQPSLESRRQYQSAILGFQLANKTAPQHLLNECSPPPPPPASRADNLVLVKYGFSAFSVPRFFVV